MHEIRWFPVGDAGREYIRDMALGETGPKSPLRRKIDAAGSTYALLDPGTPNAVVSALRSGGLGLMGDPEETIVQFLNAQPNQTFLALDMWMEASDPLPRSDRGLTAVTAFGSPGLLGVSGQIDSFSLLHMMHQIGFIIGILVSSFAVPAQEVEAGALSANTEQGLVDQLNGFFLAAYDKESWVAWTVKDEWIELLDLSPVAKGR